MNAAVLCPGPSLASWDRCDFDGYDLTAGVNRAVLYAPCHWWVFGDDTLFTACPNVSAASAFTSAESHRRLMRSPAADRLAAMTVSIYETRPDVLPLALGWAIFTATAALVLAASLGATQIDVYGSDWTDRPDFDGVSLESNRRTAERWETEQAIWLRVCERLAQDGVTVTRIHREN